MDVLYSVVSVLCGLVQQHFINSFLCVGAALTCLILEAFLSDLIFLLPSSPSLLQRSDASSS